LLIGRITQNYNFQKIWWKGDAWFMEKSLDFGGKLYHLTLGLG